MTTFRILGPIEACDDGRAVSLGGQRQVVLLAALVINANRALSSDALIDLVWGGPGDRPEAAVKRLQMAIARLRSVLEPLRVEGREPMLRTVTGGYLLAVAPGDIDAEVFEASLAEGRAALESGEAARAAARLSSALALWRGPALAEVAFADFAQVEIRRLDELRYGALEARVEADLALGRHATLIGELTALHASDPGRERLAGQLMQALYRCGRQAEALDVYHRTQAYLAGELGLSPGPALEAAQRAILTHETSPWPTAAAALERAAAERGATPERPLRGAAPPLSGDPSTVALPAVTPRVQAGAFVGRDECLYRLSAAWREVCSGATSVVVVVGPAGIGKTRLAAQFAEEVHGEGGTVLYGRADAESLATFQPFVEALRHLLTRGGDAFAVEAEREREVLSRLLPDLGPPGRHASAEASETLRYQLFEAVAALIAQATNRWPLLLVLDDLHWADRPTLLLLRHLLRHPDLSRLLVIATFRPSETDAAPAATEFLAELRRDRRYERVELAGLDVEATHALVRDRLGIDPSLGLVRRLHEQTGGNAFFIEETVRALHDTGGEATEAALERLGVPKGVSEVILRHVRRLSPAAAELLGAASVVGQDFSLAVAERLANAGSEAVIRALEEALAAQLIVEREGAPDSFAFAHAVVREVLYRQLTSVRRGRLHLRVAQAIEAVGPGGAELNPGELAHHYEQARHLAGPEPARRYAILAGDRAARLFSYEESASHFEHAIDLLDPGQEEERCELLLALGRVQYHGADPRARDTFLLAADSARRRGAAEQLARAALGLGERYWETAYVGSRFGDLLEEAATLLGDADSPLRALVVARLAENLAFPAHHERAPRLSAEALAIARRIGDEDVLIQALLARHVTRLDIRNLDERLALMDELLRCAGDHLELSAERHQWRLYDLLEAGDVQAARQDHARLETLAAELRQPLFQTLAAGWGGVLAELSGDVELAERCAQECRRHAERAHARDAESTWAAKVFALRRRAERLAEMETLTERLARDGRPGWLPALGILRAELGDRAAAQRILDDALREGPAALPEGMFRLVTLALFADLTATLGHLPHAESLYAALEPYAHRFVVIGYSSCWGPVERFLAMLADVMGDAARADRHARAALALARAIGAPLLAEDVEQRHPHLLAA